MQSMFTTCLIGLLLVFRVGADSLLQGRVLSLSGEPMAGAQVLLFDLTDLRAAPLATATDGSGHFTLPLATLAGALPERFELGANYPNPFNPSTIIPYQLLAPMHVRLEVFNVLGQRIATLVDGERTAGFHTASWDATDAKGQAVAAGVYLYRLSGDGVQTTRSMLLIDGQAGIPLGGPSGAASAGAGLADEAGATAPVYGLTVSAPGQVPYLDPALRIEAGMAPLEVVLEAPGHVPSGKAATSGGILGDVDNTGGVDFFDALLVALHSQDSSIVMPNNGDISLGDVDADGQVDLTDAWLIAAWLNDPSDPALPAGIGEAVGPAASLSPDPATVTFAADGAWHRFTVEAREPVTVVANPGADTPRLEITTSSGRGNYCPAEADDDVSRRDGQTVYLAGCAEGSATVELRRRSDNTVLQTYTFEVTGSPADLVVESVSVSDTTLTPGQSFTLSATVRNQGPGAAAATTLRWYRSRDRTISTQDTEVGTDQVGALGAFHTSTVSISLTAPSSEGTYHYGACVDNVSGESADNNCSRAANVTVAEATGGDDTTYGVGETLPNYPSGFFSPAVVSGATVRISGGRTTISINNGGFVQLQDETRYTCIASGGCSVEEGRVTSGTIRVTTGSSGGGDSGGTPPSSTSFALDSNNRNPAGITYVNNRFYVVDDKVVDDKVYVYTSSWQRVSSSDFALDSNNSWPDGITYVNNRFYMVDDGDDKVYVYTNSGQRVASADFDLDSNNSEPRDITYANNRFYVLDRIDNKVYVYTNSGQRVASADFDLVSSYPNGMTYANNRFYVVDTSDAKVYVYTNSGQRVASADFDLDNTNANPGSIIYANNRFYVFDWAEKKVYVYSDLSGSGGSSSPDLIVASPSVSDNTLTPRQSFTAESYRSQLRHGSICFYDLALLQLV